MSPELPQHNAVMRQNLDEISLSLIFGLLRARRVLLAGITSAAATLSVISVLMIPNYYRAEALLVPNDSAGSNAQSSWVSQYGGLAQLAGVDLGASSSDKVTLALEILSSRKFIMTFIEKHDLLVPLIAAKNWDVDTGELVIDTRKYDIRSDTWVRRVSPPKETVPSLLEAYEEFIDLLSVSRDDITGVVVVSVEHYSPVVAKQWVDWLIADLNATVMQVDVREAEEAIAYLNEQIQSTSLSELQNVFFRLIEDQTKTVMLARVTDEYVLRTIDPAVRPEEKVFPPRALIVLLATFISFIFAVMVIVAIGGRVDTLDESN